MSHGRRMPRTPREWAHAWKRCAATAVRDHNRLLDENDRLRALLEYVRKEFSDERCDVSLRGDPLPKCGYCLECVIDREMSSR